MAGYGIGKLICVLVAAMFAAATFSAYAADQSTHPPPHKHAKKKHKSTGAPTDQVQPGVTAGHESVKQPGRADPKVTQGGGPVTSPTPTGPGRADNQ